MPGVGTAGWPAAALAAYLVVGLPALALRRYRRLCGSLPPGGRIRSYRSGMARQWLLAGLALAALAIESVSPAAIGLTTRVLRPGALLPGLATAVAVGLVVTLVLREHPRPLQRLLRPVAALLPATPAERRAFACVAVTAGITEELLYRGFLTHLAGQAGLGRQAALTAVSAAFGLAHLYQGPVGMLGTGVAGYVLGDLALASGGLLLPIVVHALVDLRVLMLVGRTSAGSGADRGPRAGAGGRAG
ncbi:MAG: CPBP family intramembrane glutamic endopeptidase [Mycobacteriales bacterium]